jgi:hypothetical protein
MWIRYTDGRTLTGILLALNGGTIRVAIQDGDDVAEYRLIGDRWVSEDCEPVTFEFPLAAFQAAGIIPETAQPEPPSVSISEALPVWSPLVS